MTWSGLTMLAATTRRQKVPSSQVMAADWVAMAAVCVASSFAFSGLLVTRRKAVWWGVEILRQAASSS